MDVLQTRRVAGPCGQILQVSRVVFPRKVFRQMLEAARGEFFIKSFRQYRPKECGGRTGRPIVADAQQKSVVCTDIKGWIVLRVVFRIEIQRHIF